MSTRRPHAVMALAFFPRGGSAHVARNLATTLPATGWDVTVLTGSVSLPGRPGDARDFYRGLDVAPVDMTDAIAAPDPVLADPPLHPSYEDRPGAHDRVFASLDDAAFEHQVTSWCRALQSVGAAHADVLHLHHLTPINEAAARVAPGVPIVGHLHGTELTMLEEIAADPRRWAHGEAWLQRMCDWAGACRRLLVLTTSHAERAQRVLGIEPELTTIVPNGFDPDVFVPRHVDHRAHWRRHLVEEPRGWAPGEDAGSVRYVEADLAAFGDERAETPVIVYVGRYTAVKRLALLIEAYDVARRGFATRAPLVLLGGFPGEWEGEHPLEAIRRTGAQDVFLAGWHDHDELPSFLAAADVLVLPSVGEEFGQVIVEAMACGLPAIAVDLDGPAEIIRHGETGWLVEPDAVVHLANALVEAVNRPLERRRRGARASEDAHERFALPALAQAVAAAYDAAREAEPELVQAT